MTMFDWIFSEIVLNIVLSVQKRAFWKKKIKESRSGVMNRIFWPVDDDSIKRLHEKKKKGFSSKRDFSEFFWNF